MKSFRVCIEVIYEDNTKEYFDYYEKGENAEELREIIQHSCDITNKKTNEEYNVYVIEESEEK